MKVYRIWISSIDSDYRWVPSIFVHDNPREAGEVVRRILSYNIADMEVGLYDPHLEVEVRKEEVTDYHWEDEGLYEVG